jgi:dihydroneopterin aldolase
MAVLAMDQCAHLIVSRLPGSRLVFGPQDIGDASTAGWIPVLAPFNWLRTTDPLPHSWDVTSDSIASWVAGTLAARKLLLVKPPHAQGPSLVDAYFDRARPSRVEVEVITADRTDDLRRFLEA